MSAPATQNVQNSSNPWENAERLVFLGFQVSWTRRVSDAAMNLQLAENWDADFSTWAVANRRVDLRNPDLGYFVGLRDGGADFRCESFAAYQKALEHATELSSLVVRRKREQTIAQFQAQFLKPSEKSFDLHQTNLQQKLLKPEFTSAIGANIIDLAYLVDCFIEGRWYQVEGGPVRAEEIPKRVTATLKEHPKVATFLKVTGRKPFEYEISDLAEAVLQTVTIGNRIMRELNS